MKEHKRTMKIARASYKTNLIHSSSKMTSNRLMERMMKMKIQKKKKRMITRQIPMRNIRKSR
jgi:hypothetical protein